jgi:hypothetical protein
MAERSAALAQQFEQAVAEFASLVEGLTDEQWRRRCPDEERPVGVVARHVAKGIPFEMDVFRVIADGRQPATTTRAALGEMNAADADAWADCDRTETLALLRDYAASAAAEVRTWDDAQFARSGFYVEELSEPWTIEQWIERILIGHVHGHLRSIRAALDQA